MDWLINLIAPIANRWSWLGKFVNRVAINRAVNVSRIRPHPWSNAHPYVSWTSMSDRNWSARHLPETKTPRPVPDKDSEEMRNLLALFLRGDHEPKFCDKSTLLFPAFAQYLTDGFIRTKMPNKSRGEIEPTIDPTNFACQVPL
mgnify:CR=1 FL=1